MGKLKAIARVFLWILGCLSAVSLSFELATRLHTSIGFHSSLLSKVFIIAPGVLIYTSICILFLKRLWRHHSGQGPPGLCPFCGYDIRGQTVRCPECGNATSEATELLKIDPQAFSNNWRLKIIAVVSTYLFVITLLCSSTVWGWTHFSIQKVSRTLQKWHRQPFRSNDWRIAQNSPASAFEVRQCMVDDLLKQVGVVGRTVKEVEYLLGPPDARDYLVRGDYAYCLGYDRGFIQDISYLVITFGLDGKVSRVEVLGSY